MILLVFEKTSEFYYKMGNYLGRNTLSKENIKQHVKYELSTLLCNNIIKDSRSVTTNFTVSKRRLISLKKHMGLVRTFSEEWSNILDRSANISIPWHVTLRLILEQAVPHRQGHFKVGHLIVICAYMSDICAMNLCRNKTVDVCVVVETLVDILVERRLDTCVQFLNYLDV